MTYDYIVIGSGFGGSVAALRLVEKGYSVLMIEQGKRFSPADFPKTNMNLPRYLWMPALRFFGFQKLTFFREASILSGVGVGGGSLVYANTLYIPPDAFFSNNSWSAFGNWKEILLPFYNTASFMLGRTKYAQTNTEDELLRQVAEDMNASGTFESVFVGVNLKGSGHDAADPYFGGKGPERKECSECAGCMVGCRENAKNSLDRNYLWFAEQLGLKLLAETKAEKISFSDGVYTVETRRITSIGKSTGSYRAKGIVVAAGTLGTLELLLKQKYHYRTLTGLSDKLGHEVRTNSETLCAVSGVPAKLNNGLAITSVFSPDQYTHAEIVKYPDGSNAMKWFFGLSVDGASHPVARTLKLFRKTVMHPARFFKTVFSSRWSEGMVIFLVMQTVDTAMKIIWKKTLSGGKIKIDNSGQRKVPAYIPVAQEVMERYARKTGGIAQNILLEVVFDRPTTAHILGGCPMSSTSGQGVIDKNLKVHGYPDFYITDGSAIQGNIGVNPSLTITAMAEYAMNSIPMKEGAAENEITGHLYNLEKEWTKSNCS